MRLAAEREKIDANNTGDSKIAFVAWMDRWNTRAVVHRTRARKLGRLFGESWSVRPAVQEQHAKQRASRTSIGCSTGCVCTGRVMRLARVRSISCAAALWLVRMDGGAGQGERQLLLFLLFLKEGT